jgi:hypothetical protein
MAILFRHFGFLDHENFLNYFGLQSFDILGGLFQQRDIRFSKMLQTFQRKDKRFSRSQLKKSLNILKR